MSISKSTGTATTPGHECHGGLGPTPRGRLPAGGGAWHGHPRCLQARAACTATPPTALGSCFHRSSPFHKHKERCRDAVTSRVSLPGSHSVSARSVDLGCVWTDALNPAFGGRRGHCVLWCFSALSTCHSAQHGQRQSKQTQTARLFIKTRDVRGLASTALGWRCWTSTCDTHASSPTSTVAAARGPQLQHGVGVQLPKERPGLPGSAPGPLPRGWAPSL